MRTVIEINFTRLYRILETNMNKAQNQKQLSDETAEASRLCDMCEEEIDYNLMGTFPASDPPSWTLGISPRKKFRSEFGGKRVSIDEPTHQNESVD